MASLTEDLKKLKVSDGGDKKGDGGGGGASKKAASKSEDAAAATGAAAGEAASGGAGGGSSGAGAGSSASAKAGGGGATKAKDSKVVIKVGMVGDAQIGKTSLMVKYVEGKFDEDYIQTLGVNFMEKTIRIKKTNITFSIWDLGGQREFISMLPLVCNDAVAILCEFWGDS